MRIELILGDGAEQVRLLLQSEEGGGKPEDGDDDKTKFSVLTKQLGQTLEDLQKLYTKFSVL